MKYKIYVAEDEPPILRDIVNKIKIHCSDYEVVGQAFNGEDALKDILRLKPDVLCTDIRMPLMDGLELIMQIKIHLPNMIFIILSGYQEFEYAKKAIHLGVEDYILKPIDIEALSRILSQVKIRMGHQNHSRSFEALNSIINLNTDTTLMNYLEYEFYSLLFICINNPLNNYPNLKRYVDSINNIIDTVNLDQVMKEILLDVGCNYWIISGKFPNEKIIVFGSNQIEKLNLLQISQEITNRIQACNAYVTLALGDEKYSKENILEKVEQLQYIARGAAIIGRNQILSDVSILTNDWGMFAVFSDVEKRIVAFCQNGQMKSLMDEIGRLFKSWIKDSIPQRILEINIRQILRSCANNTNILIKTDIIQVDEKVQQIFMFNSNEQTILDEILKLIETFFPVQAEKTKLAHEELVNSIESYLNANFAKKISMEEISETFGITESYTCKLFKKYKGETPIDYLLKLRVEKAKEIMVNYPEMMIKDIAVVTGFNDQYYFSRIFKSLIGMTPTEFRAK